MGVDGFAYNLFLLLHVLAAIVGFGGVLLNGVYAAKSRALPPDQALAVMETNAFVSMKVAEKAIYAVALFGVALVEVSDDVWSWSNRWVWLSLVLYVAAIGVSHGALGPAVKEMLALQREVVEAGPPTTAGPPPQVTRMAELGKKLGATSMYLDLSLVAILVLMIWKPT